MDALSAVANIVAVIQLANAVITVCYEFRANLQNAPSTLSRITQELRELRSVLETLEGLAEKETHLPTLRLLFESPQGSALDACVRELQLLERKLQPPSWMRRMGNKTRALGQTVVWTLHDSDAQKILERLDRCKNTFQLAISADEARVLHGVNELVQDLNSTVNRIDDSVEDLRGIVRTISERLKSQDLDKEQREILAWLAPVTPDATHEATCKLRRPGTSRWFMSSKEWISWYEKPGTTLWVKGGAGAGKTTLFSAAVDHLRAATNEEPPRGILAYFYCDFRQPETQKATSVLGCLVAQLCSQQGYFPALIEEAFHRCNPVGGGKRPPPSLKTLEELLQDLSSKFGVILMIDALDECDDYNELARLLVRLNSKDNKLQILVASRDEREIQMALESPSVRPMSLTAHRQEMMDDIVTYIDDRMASERRISGLDGKFKAEIRLALVQGSCGMFRWVQCQMDELCTLRLVKTIRAALDKLPTGLNETYERALLRLHGEDIVLVRRILLWLSFDVFSMHVADLQEAVAIDLRSGDLDPEAMISSPDDIIEMCGSLIRTRYSGVSGPVSLAHHSVREYLLSENLAKSPAKAFAINRFDGSLTLAECCLTYLSSTDFQSGPLKDRTLFEARMAKHPLAKHAAMAWPYHAKEARHASPPKDPAAARTQARRLERLNQKVLHFLTNPSNDHLFMCWIQLLNSHRPQRGLKWDFRYPDHATPLYYAASFGLYWIVDLLLTQPAINVNQPGGRYGGPPLHAAIWRGHLKIAERLLQAGADPRFIDQSHQSAMHLAKATRSIEAQALLKKYIAKQRWRKALTLTRTRTGREFIRNEDELILAQKQAERERQAVFREKKRLAHEARRVHALVPGRVEDVVEDGAVVEFEGVSEAPAPAPA